MVRTGAINAVLVNYSALMQALEVVAEESNDAASKAAGLAVQIETLKLTLVLI